MKKVLIIEDNQVVATVYRNKLAAEGYQTEIALDGESGLQMVRTFRPDLLVLDLILPKMSGVEVIREIRSAAEFARLPIIVFSNTYLTHLMQEAWKAGANKCLSKASCSPRHVLDIIRQSLGDSGAASKIRPGAPGPVENQFEAGGISAAGPQDAAFQADLQKSFRHRLPGTLADLRAGANRLLDAGDEMTRLKQIYELYRRLHALTGSAGIAGLLWLSKMSDAVEALLKELYEQPKNINSSTLGTVAAGVDMLGFLFESSAAQLPQEILAGDVLVVDDEPISRRAITYALEKARLQSTPAEDPDTALKLLAEKDFDLVILDGDLPGMTGYELCDKMRALPRHRNTAVLFVAPLSDFADLAGSPKYNGGDFIAKPFLFIELTVKALRHVLRAKLPPENRRH